MQSPITLFSCTFRVGYTPQGGAGRTPLANQRLSPRPQSDLAMQFEMAATPLALPFGFAFLRYCRLAFTTGQHCQPFVADLLGIDAESFA